MENIPEPIDIDSADDNDSVDTRSKMVILCDYPKRGIPGALGVSLEDYRTLNPEIYLNDSIIGICL